MAAPKGNKFAKGGPRPGSGRPKDDTRKLFQNMLVRSGAHLRFEKLMQTAPDELFLKAYQVCLDRAHGKPQVAVEHSGLEGVNILAFLEQSRQERGLDD